MKSIRKWLEEDAGITLSVASLTSYISRIRRRRSGTLPVPRLQPGPEPRPDDPLAPAMRALSKPRLDIRTIHGDGDPETKNLI